MIRGTIDEEEEEYKLADWKVDQKSTRKAFYYQMKWNFTIFVLSRSKFSFMQH